MGALNETKVTIPHVEFLVEAIVESMGEASRRGVSSKQRFLDTSIAIYAAIGPDEPIEDQMLDMGKLVSVLLWKLAEARGVVT